PRCSMSIHATRSRTGRRSTTAASPIRNAPGRWSRFRFGPRRSSLIRTMRDLRDRDWLAHLGFVRRRLGVLRRLDRNVRFRVQNRLARIGHAFWPDVKATVRSEVKLRRDFPRAPNSLPLIETLIKDIVFRDVLLGPAAFAILSGVEPANHKLAHVI